MEAALPLAIQAGGQILGGISGLNQAGAQSALLKQRAGQVEASSQRDAELARKEGEIVQSKQRANAAASGASATDPTVQNIEAETGRNAEYNALSALYEGKAQAQDLDTQASLTTKAAQANMVGSILGSGATIFDKYKGDLPPWMGGSTDSTGFSSGFGKTGYG